MKELDKTGLEAAEAEFTAYFVKNYPGPNTIINDPRWHAPKLFRAAKHALSVHLKASATTSAGVTEEQTPQFWLAELDPHGNPRLLDGAHRTREGVEKAAYLHMRLGLQKGLTFACAEVHITPVEAAPHGANEEALSILSARSQPHER